MREVSASIGRIGGASITASRVVELMLEVVLVIEDEPGIVDFLERGLEAQGFEVRSALDGISGAQRALAEDAIWSCWT